MTVPPTSGHIPSGQHLSGTPLGPAIPLFWPDVELNMRRLQQLSVLQMGASL